MNINDPVSFPRIQKLHREFDLQFYRSSEQQIADTWARFMSAGAAICPQGAVALDAVQQARESGKIKPHDTVVTISTASALKFTDAGIRYHKSKGLYANPLRVIEGDLTSLEKSFD
jgi:threonine synthase